MKEIWQEKQEAKRRGRKTWSQNWRKLERAKREGKFVREWWSDKNIWANSFRNAFKNQSVSKSRRLLQHFRFHDSWMQLLKFTSGWKVHKIYMRTFIITLDNQWIAKGWVKLTGNDMWKHDRYRQSKPLFISFRRTRRHWCENAWVWETICDWITQPMKNDIWSQIAWSICVGYQIWLDKNKRAKICLFLLFWWNHERRKIQIKTIHSCRLGKR